MTTKHIDDQTWVSLSIVYVLLGAVFSIAIASAIVVFRSETAIADIDETKREVAEIQRDRTAKREQMLEYIHRIDKNVTRIMEHEGIPEGDQ